MDCAVSAGSAGSMASALMVRSSSSPWPLTVALTSPPPAVPSTSASASSCCAFMSWSCICCAAASSCCMSSWPPGSTMPPIGCRIAAFAIEPTGHRARGRGSAITCAEPRPRPGPAGRQRAVGRGHPRRAARRLAGFLDHPAAELPLDEVHPGQRPRCLVLARRRPCRLRSGRHRASPRRAGPGGCRRPGPPLAGGRGRRLRRRSAAPAAGAAGLRPRGRGPRDVAGPPRAGRPAVPRHPIRGGGLDLRRDPEHRPQAPG